MNRKRRNKFGDLGDLGNLGGPKDVDRDVRATIEQIAVATRFIKTCPTARQVSRHGSPLKKSVVPEYLWNNLARVIDLGYAEEFQDAEGEFRYELTKKGKSLVFVKTCIRDGTGTRWVKPRNYHRLIFGDR